MPTIELDLTPDVLSALRLSPQEFVSEMRIEAAVQWYAQQRVSQGKAAEIAGISRSQFLTELGRRNVPACQVSADELADEVEMAVADRR
jgi:predicted HTH domain antitoxin